MASAPPRRAEQVPATSAANQTRRASATSRMHTDQDGAVPGRRNGTQRQGDTGIRPRSAAAECRCSGDCTGAPTTRALALQAISESLRLRAARAESLWTTAEPLARLHLPNHSSGAGCFAARGSRQAWSRSATVTQTAHVWQASATNTCSVTTYLTVVSRRAARPGHPQCHGTRCRLCCA